MRGTGGFYPPEADRPYQAVIAIPDRPRANIVLNWPQTPVSRISPEISGWLGVSEKLTAIVRAATSGLAVSVEDDWIGAGQP